MQLFPVILTEHDTSWKNKYLKEKKSYGCSWSNQHVRISHYNTTAVSNLLAKSTIDILLEVVEMSTKTNL